MNEQKLSIPIQAVIVCLFCLALCIFAKWRADRENTEFRFTRVLLMLVVSFSCGIPFAFLAWCCWPLESFIEKLLPLIAFLACLSGPLVSIRVFGWKLLLPKRSPVEKVAEEIFDVVNDRDEVIDRRPRFEVHRLGLKHRATHVLVFNSRGEVFLQKRSMQKDREPGVWDSSVSGHVDAGEDYDACAVRELREEIGLRVGQVPERLFKLGACAETDQEFVWVYRCRHEGPFTLHPEEIEGGGWFAPAEVNRWMKERPQDFAGALLFLWKRLGL